MAPRPLPPMVEADLPSPATKTHILPTAAPREVTKVARVSAPMAMLLLAALTGPALGLLVAGALLGLGLPVVADLLEGVLHR